jgi:hypothetical protein
MSVWVFILWLQGCCLPSLRFSSKSSNHQVVGGSLPDLGRAEAVEDLLEYFSTVSAAKIDRFVLARKCKCLVGLSQRDFEYLAHRLFPPSRLRSLNIGDARKLTFMVSSKCNALLSLSAC